MHIPTTSQIEHLIAEAAGPYVSVYMPTHRCGAETLQDPIRLKNLIRDADQQLQAIGCASGDIDHLLHPLTAMLADYDFWQHQMDGLMIFRGKDLFESYQVDMAVSELAVVGDRPHLKPMLALMSSDARYYVLALSQNRAQLFQGTREGLAAVELEGMPRSLEETWPEQRESAALQSHSGSAPKAGGGSVVVHGQGSGQELTKERMQIYFRKIDQALHTLLAASATPLILATVDYLAPIYRKVNSHPGLQAKWVSGNPDTLSAAELHVRALPIALETFEASRRQAADRYLELWHTQRASNELAGVLPAAVCGRVDALFAAVGVQVWGAYNPSTGEVRISESCKSGEQDLLNLAAMHAFTNGGAVYAVPRSEVPGGGVVAAVYRY